MPTNFNPFAQWLGLNPKIANPHHFQLLGVSTKITDPDEIEKAVEAGVKRNLMLLEQIPAGEHDAVIKHVKQRISIARATLLDSDARQVYLTKLKQASKSQKSGAATGTSTAPNSVDLSPPSKSSPATEVSGQTNAKSGADSEFSNVDSFTATAPRKPVFTPPTIGEAPPATTSPIAKNAVKTEQPIPMAVPLGPSGQPVVANANKLNADGVAVNSDGVPIDEVRIQKKAASKKKKSKVGLVAGIIMLLAALVGAFLIYLNLDALLRLGGVDPEVVPVAPGIMEGKDDAADRGDGSPSIPPVTAKDSIANSETESSSSQLPVLDLDSIPELNIEDVINDPETEMVTGRNSERQKELNERNQARLKAMGLDDPPESANLDVDDEDTIPSQPGLENETDSSPLGEIVSLNELQLAQYRRQLERARRSLFRRDKGTALKSIQRANAILDEVRTDENARFSAAQAPIAALADESKEIYDLIEGFWEQVVASCQSIPGGQEIVASGQTIGFVEADKDKFIVRHAGSNVTYEYYFCPPALAVELAKQGAIPDIPTWNKQLAAFYAVNQVNGIDHREKIDELLQLSEDAGHECGGIRHFAVFEFGNLGKPPQKIAMPNKKAFNEGVAEFRSEHDYADVGKLAQGTAAMFAELLLQIDSPNLEQHVVLLEEARRLGIRSGEAAITEDSIIELNNFAEIDHANLLCDSYLELADNELTIAQRRDLMEHAIPFLKSSFADSAKLKSRQQLAKKLMDITAAYGMTDAARRINQLDQKLK